ncbi:MAG: SDR family oxidoreductase [Streptosporangiaceae bacterium]|jgi:2-hydroxycyclohexanecarboxyl-CoA dehydrogenase
MTKPDRVAFVTGGAGGIGAAVCRALVSDGRRVAVADLSQEACNVIAKEIDGVGIRLDVRDPDSVSAALGQARAVLGDPEIIVNVAGWDEQMPFLKTDEAFTEKVMQVNLYGPIRLLRAALPAMVAARWGRVVNVASDAGRVGSSNEAVYSGAKGGLIAFTKTIAREFARYEITSNSVCPGPTDTPLIRRMIAEQPDADKVIAAMTRAVPMRRMGQPEDVGAAVAFMASESAGHITGQTLSVSGGLTMV